VYVGTLLVVILTIVAVLMHFLFHRFGGETLYVQTERFYHRRLGTCAIVIHTDIISSPSTNKIQKLIIMVDLVCYLRTPHQT
jgi:hypothetical protein